MASAKATGSVTAGMFLTRLKRNGSTETQNSSRMFRLFTLLVSIGKTDMMRV